MKEIFQYLPKIGSCREFLHFMNQHAVTNRLANLPFENKLLKHAQFVDIKLKTGFH